MGCARLLFVPVVVILSIGGWSGAVVLARDDLQQILAKVEKVAFLVVMYGHWQAEIDLR
jgi:hypothetical protein